MIFPLDSHQGCGLREGIGNGHVQSSAITNDRLETSHIRVFRDFYQSFTQCPGETRKKRKMPIESSRSKDFREDVLKIR
jgi:hypothetical protein